MTNDSEQLTFDGEPVEGVVLRVRGGISASSAGGLKIGSEVYVIGKAVIDGSTHRKTDAGLVRIDMAKLDEGEVMDPFDAANLILNLREARTGQTEIPVPPAGEEKGGDAR